ncbi:LysR family transcriptional regulator [Mesorhizobium sp. NFR06]|uniref:LysR family transcriptional regulator n=1 Tax=Mesorhizobium sp. NFR06 TaxID=1566290 RepID=UPI0032AEB1E8
MTIRCWIRRLPFGADPGAPRSQPAVSQYVKQLEAVLGFALFKRSANRIIPLQEAWELLRNVELEHVL